ncbi:MAG TPA: hypothetical protein ENN40_10115 [Candidatus Aminicenantes bacterium]|nr:hypothetical protein [Candidatus Aminicenantes bacterium]
MKPCEKKRILWCGAILIPGVLRIMAELLPPNFISGWLSAMVAVTVVVAAAAGSIYMAASALDSGNAV